MGKFGFAALGKRIKLSVFSFDVQPTIALGFALHWTWVWVTFWSSTFYSISPAPGILWGELLTILGARQTIVYLSLIHI